jgi:hypothetical protein
MEVKMDGMWFVHNWRESLDAWHDDIRTLLNIPR